MTSRTTTSKTLGSRAPIHATAALSLVGLLFVGCGGMEPQPNDEIGQVEQNSLTLSKDDATGGSTSDTDLRLDAFDRYHPPSGGTYTGHSPDSGWTYQYSFSDPDHCMKYSIYNLGYCETYYDVYFWDGSCNWKSPKFTYCYSY